MPSEVFHSSFPLKLAPPTNAAAAEGLEKRISYVRM
jgi:hypothetical protein